MGAQDEATFGLIPIVQRGWAKKGSHPFVKISHSNVCTNVIAARSSKSFVFVFSKKKNRKQFVRFLEKLKGRWGKFLLFTDNYKPHKGGIVEKYIQSHKKTVKVVYFSKYSPEVNPVEQCWKPGRKILSNRVIPSLNAAKYHLRKTFRNKNSMPKMFEYLRD